jgi:hypothetical protein
MSEEANTRILKVLAEKILLKKEVFEKTEGVFKEIKVSLAELVKELKSSVKEMSADETVYFEDSGEYEAQFTLCDETLLFVIHTNIFTFDNNHEIWRNKYVQLDPKRAYCGKIFIYNFLSDSFKYNRSNDLGYLLARIFVNREGHFFVEGKKNLGYTFNEFSANVFDKQQIKEIIQNVILYSLDFDPFTPPFERITEISVREVQEAGLQNRITTGKRLGFQFESENKNII